MPGHGLCADSPPYGDNTAYEEMCPLLKNQLPDGSYPCGLVGTPYEAVFDQCMDMGEGEWSDASVAEWQANHPLCSYVFVEV